MKLGAIGSNCVDYYENLQDGRAFPGGGPVNMAVYTLRMGGEAAYVGPVGRDENGEIIRKAMEKKGVDISRLQVREGKTAVSMVELRGSERHFTGYDEGVLKNYTLSEMDLDFLGSCDVVAADLWGRVEEYLPELKKRGVKTAFDCATAPESTVSQKAIPYTDYLFFSAREDTETLRESMRRYHQAGPSLVIATLGEKGSLCFDGESFHACGIVPCTVVDTLGAGDSYIAGFLFGVTEGLSIEKAMEKGAACAAETIGYFGAW